MKTCRTCKVSKPEAEFYSRTVNDKAYLNPDCKTCFVAKAMERRKAVRVRVTERLGGKCFCCGETEPMFLTIDHKDGDGAAHRRELNNIGGKLYIWLAGRPEEDHRFQVACWNCNSGRDLNGGLCPHQVPAVLGTQ
jgi:hypothetical protein